MHAMATLRDRLNTLLRFRVGKFDSNTLPNDMGIYGHTVSGANVNETTAMSISTVYACTNKIASTVASLGLEVMVRDNREVYPLMRIRHTIWSNISPTITKRLTSFGRQLLAMQ